MTKPKSKICTQQIDKDYQSNKDMVRVNPKDAIERAKKNLAIVKEMEIDKKDFVWITKEKTQKHVHISKVEMYLSEGWKTNQKITE